MERAEEIGKLEKADQLGFKYTLLIPLIDSLFLIINLY